MHTRQTSALKLGHFFLITVLCTLFTSLTICFAEIKADFSGQPREGEVPLTVKFTDQSEGQISI
ncbi:hypothetical protein JW935_28685 [candidate division KSB1 bacterium]|nr:hypothetical protein [candidate division KSB1 bacterium]